MPSPDQLRRLKPRMHCPDADSCQHGCVRTCWRVKYASPRSGAYPDNTWPDSILEANADPTSPLRPGAYPSLPLSPRLEAVLAAVDRELVRGQAELAAKHEQWQEATRLGAQERTRRQALEAGLRVMLHDMDLAAFGDVDSSIDRICSAWIAQIRTLLGDET